MAPDERLGHPMSAKDVTAVRAVGPRGLGEDAQAMSRAYRDRLTTSTHATPHPGRPPAATTVGPALAEPLAALLDALATGLPAGPDGTSMVSTESYRSAVAVASIVVGST
jgi:hypothetical protein